MVLPPPPTKNVICRGWKLGRWTKKQSFKLLRQLKQRQIALLQGTNNNLNQFIIFRKHILEVRTPKRRTIFILRFCSFSYEPFPVHSTVHPNFRVLRVCLYLRLLVFLKSSSPLPGLSQPSLILTFDLICWWCCYCSNVFLLTSHEGCYISIIYTLWDNNI